jgi:hypothetical protein
VNTDLGEIIIIEYLMGFEIYEELKYILKMKDGWDK